MSEKWRLSANVVPKDCWQTSPAISSFQTCFWIFVSSNFLLLKPFFSKLSCLQLTLKQLDAVMIYVKLKLFTIPREFLSWNCFPFLLFSSFETRSTLCQLSWNSQECEARTLPTPNKLFIISSTRLLKGFLIHTEHLKARHELFQTNKHISKFIKGNVNKIVSGYCRVHVAN